MATLAYREGVQLEWVLFLYFNKIMRKDLPEWANVPSSEANCMPIQSPKAGHDSNWRTGLIIKQSKTASSASRCFELWSSNKMMVSNLQVLHV